MWNGILLKTIRWITFIPLCVLSLGLIQTLLGLLVYGIMSLHLSMFWLILALFLVGGMIMGLFGMITTGISLLTVQFCPSVKVGGYILSILTLLSFTYTIIKLWTIQDNLNGNILGFCIVMTILYVGLCFSIIIVSMSLSKYQSVEKVNSKEEVRQELY